MTLKLLELCGEEADRNFSPYCWRIRMALAHKGLAYESVPWRYTETDRIKAYGSTKVPILLNGEETVADSWKIANYLETKFSDLPSLFGGEGGRATTAFLNAWTDSSLVMTVFPLIGADVLRHLGAEDSAYFRKTREAFIGKTLEAAEETRAQDVLRFRRALDPLRMALRHQPYLCGSGSGYADYIVFSIFQWARTVSAFKLLADDDQRIIDWRARLLGAFDGLALQATGYDV